MYRSPYQHISPYIILSQTDKKKKANSMDKDISTSHRDLKRCNKANASVQGCIYADINKNRIDKLIENEKNELDIMNGDEVMNLLNIAKDSSVSSKRLLVNSHNSISKRHWLLYNLIY